MLDTTLKFAIEAYFDVEDLARLLNIDIIDFVQAFEDEILDNEDLIVEEMNLGQDIETE